MKKLIGGGLGGMVSLLFLPLVFFMMLSLALSQSTSGVVDGQDGKENLFDLYYREPLLQTQRDTGVLVPAGWIYGSMWFYDVDSISQEKVQTLINEAYTCEEDKCELVTLEQYIENVIPILTKTVTSEELKRNILLFADTDTIYFGKVPEKVSEYKGLSMAYPLELGTYVVTARYGMYDPFNTGNWTMHSAIDLAPTNGIEGQPLFSMIDGIVVEKGYGNATGFYVTVQNKDYPELEIRYSHMKSLSPQLIGASVKKTQQVGYLGNTGQSTGAHVHINMYIDKEAFNPELIFIFD